MATKSDYLDLKRQNKSNKNNRDSQKKDALTIVVKITHIKLK